MAAIQFFRRNLDELFCRTRFHRKPMIITPDNHYVLDFWQKDCGATLNQTHGGV